jgi:hypothetical protein
MLLRFVDQPSLTPTVLLEVGPYLLAREFDPGVPEFSGSPLSIGAEDGYRTARMRLQAGTSYADAAAFSNAFVQQLLKPHGWLMFQYDSMRKPMFLRYYRTQTQAADWTNAALGIFEFPIALTCDPYLTGEPITLGPYTITNNPRAGSGNPAFLALPAIKGDAAAPVALSVVPSVEWSGWRPLFSMIGHSGITMPGGGGYTVPIVWPVNGAGFTAGTDTAAFSANAAYVAGGFRTVSFATQAGLVTRLSGDVPTVPPPGTYKVLLRAVRSDTTTTWAARLGQNYGVIFTAWGDTKTMGRTTSPANGFATYLDLGQFTMPYGSAGLDESDIGATATPNIALQIQRVTGTGTLNIDSLVLIPTELAKAPYDAKTAMVWFPKFGVDSNRTLVLDGLNNRNRVYNFGTSLAEGIQTNIQGGYLWVWPGMTNLFQMLHQTAYSNAGGTTNTDIDSVTATASVQFVYSPRWLHLRPDTG